MKEFLTRHSVKIIGVRSGFDRIVLRGTLRQLAHLSGLQSVLSYKHVVPWHAGGRRQRLC